MEQILKECLTSVDSEFQPNELAYLALTTKIEQPLRDRWAFRLYSELSGQVTVSREWKRTDLAILENSSPKVLIELKAMYTFDAALDKAGISGFIKAMEADELKAKKLATTQTQIYTVLLATHPKAEVPVKLEGIVKYRAGINKAIRIFQSAEKVREEAVSAVENKIKEKNLVLAGSLTGGEAFGISTDVLFWVVKA